MFFAREETENLLNKNAEMKWYVTYYLPTYRKHKEIRTRMNWDCFDSDMTPVKWHLM